MCSTQQRDYYEVLGLSREADAKAIKDAFRKLALKYHPDRNKDPSAEDKFKEIAEAYAILSDPKKRAQYDSAGFAGVADFSPEDLFAGIDLGDLFDDLGFGFGAGGGIFDRFLRRQRGPVRGRDLEVLVQVPLSRIDAGGEESVSFTRPVTCAACGGSGVEGGGRPNQCKICQGSGRKILSHKKKGGVHFQQIITCPDCRGKGTLIDNPCPECRGGKVNKAEKLKVNIPAGAEEGMALRIPNHGLPGPDNHSRPGDLFVVVRSTPDPRFERLGANLWRSETLEVADAVLGTHRRVPTLHGMVDLTIPPGTQPDEVLRLRGKGLTVFGSDQRGNLNIRIEVHIPQNPSKPERQLYEQLRTIGQKRERRK